jgi:hypothetical protein
MDDDASVDDGWTRPDTEYRHSSHAQFLLFVDQLAVAREMLVAPGLSKRRMALVAIDNLAELALYRHKRRLAQAAQESWRDVEPRLDHTDEQRFRSNFNVRVELGLKGAGPGLLESVYKPVLDGLDAGLFRVGHQYRNRAYHADHHNPAALDLVARAYFNAVSRTFTRLQPTNIASSMSAATREALRAHGYDGASDAWLGGDKMMAPAEAASTITGHLSAGLEIDLPSAREVLVGDMRSRIAWTGEMIDGLLADGMPADRLEFGLRWTFAWRAISLDPTVVAVERQMREAWRRRVDEPGSRSTESFERDAELNDQRNKRIQELLAEPGKNTFDLPQRINEIATGVQRLLRARNLATLVDRYERLDTAMDQIEEMLDEAAVSWDRYIQEEVDRRRGK